MGTIPMFEDTICSPLGERFSVNVITDTESATMPEEGGVWISITEKGKQEYALVVDFCDYTESWLQKFLQVFAADPEFRKQFISADHGSVYFGDQDAEPRRSSLPELPRLRGESQQRYQAMQKSKVQQQVDDLRARAERGDARFSDFAHLRSGRDSWSACKLPGLQVQAGQDISQKLSCYHLDEADQAAALRWFLRGLTLELAVRKVRTDLEIREKATRHKKRK